MQIYTFSRSPVLGLIQVVPLRPDGPAGPPPGQGLRSGVPIGLQENREQNQDPYYKVSTVRGESREKHPDPMWVQDVLDLLRDHIAEGVGFEPTRTRQRPSGFQDR